MEIQRLKRPCKKCGKPFTPTGKFCFICEKCKQPNNPKREKNKTAYFNQKALLDALRDDVTLKKWKILSHAYKLGKELWKGKFTKQRLAYDMEIPYTTVLRCLALDKANKKSWSLVRQNKISVFKLAMICQLKSITYQDEIVKIVIEKELSTYQIKELRINSMADVNKERHRIAVEKGYSRKDSAYSNFYNWIERGKIFMLMNKEYLPKEKISQLEFELDRLNKLINQWKKI